MQSNMEPIGSNLQRKLAATRHWWRLTRLFGGVAWALSAVICVALACFHADRLMALSAPAREYWRFGIVATGVAVLFALWLRALLHRVTDAELAAEVERRFPVLRERLLTTVSLMPAMASAGGGASSSGFSQSISVALAEETQRDADSLNFRRAVDTRPVRVAILAMIFTVGLTALHMALAPDAFANWVKRMTNPRTDIAPWANTRVWVQPSAQVLPRGAGVNVIVTTRGAAADQSKLFYRATSDTSATAWKSVDLSHPTVVSNSQAPGAPTYHTMTAMLPGENRTADAVPPRQFQFHIPSLSQGLTMYAVANDGRSNDKSVTVEDRPTLLGMKMTVRYPAYTRKPAQTIAGSSGSISAPTGSEIEVVAGANKPLRSAEYRLNGRPQAMWSVHGDHASGKIAVWHDAQYSLGLVDRNGFDNPGASSYEIRAVKDQAPTVQIARPTSDIDLQPAGSLPLVAHATDDYGVNRMGLVYEMQHDAAMGGHSAGAHGSLALPGPDGKPTANVAARWHVASVRPNVGDTITYYVTATDNDAIDGPQTGRSAIFHVHVLSLTEMQKRLAEQINAEQATLAELRKRQIEAQNLLRKAQQQPNTGNLAKAQDAQRAVAQAAKAAAQRIGDISTQLENNNLATKSELDRRDEAQQIVNNIGAQKAPAAADNVQRAQPKANPASRQSLATADKQESDIKHDIEQAQEKLAPAPPAEELAKELLRLAKEQQDRADASHTLAEDINAQKKSNPGKAMAPEDRAALNLEKQHQADISRDTQRVANQLQKAAQSAAERGETKQAKALQEASQALQKGQVGQHQQSAQQNLQKDSPQQAAPQQDKAASALAKASEIAKEAANQNGDETARQAAERLEKTAEELRALAKQQKELADKTGQSQASQQSQDLAKQQRDLQNQTAQAQQNLNGAQQAQRSAQNAQQNQGKASKQLSQNSPQSAQAPAQTAAQQLQKAADEAQNAAQQMRQQQAAQELAEKVERLAQIQRGVENTTQRLQNAQQKAPLNDNERKELAQTGERQRSLEEQTKSLSDTVPSPAFQQALQAASKTMHPATQNLNQTRPNTGEMTQKAQDRAAQTLETIAQALKAQAQGGKQQDQQQQQQQEQGMSPEQQQEAAALGDLMLAQGLQKQIRQNTGKLDKQRAGQPLNPGQQQEADNLGQGEQQTRDITNEAGKSLGQIPGIGQAIQQATQHMEQAGSQLSQQQTGQPTQGHQDKAIQNLDQAIKAAQQAMQQQQQQQQQQQAGGQQMPQPNQPGNQPDKNAFTRLVGTKGGLLSSDNGTGKGFGDLSARQQRIMRDGRNDPVPAEYRDLVKRYFGEKRGK
ncbi:MAG TPA: hypothetical protein VKT77_02995 [Chthonomonadaceae bacterium]|nr:hypothetical protein [Chthonomonadaceae bacterium]